MRGCIPTLRRTVPCLCALAFWGAAAAARADFTVLATNNATVQPAGLRNGPNGQRFFNMEGSSNGAFASFGVADFTAPAGVRVDSISSLTLTLVQDNAAFTHNGALNFYLTQDTATNDVATTPPAPPNTALTFQAGSLPDGIGTQLSPRFLLGSGTFTQGTTGNEGSGTVDVFTFNFAATSALAAYLKGQINSGGDIRVIIAPGDATVAATYAGFRDTSFSGPRLTAVPEPSSLALIGVGGVAVVGLLARRRLRAAIAG